MSKKKTTSSNQQTIQRWLIFSVGIYIVLVFNLMDPFGITIDQFIPVYYLMLSSYGVISALTVFVCIRCLPQN